MSSIIATPVSIRSEQSVSAVGDGLHHYRQSSLVLAAGILLHLILRYWRSSWRHLPPGPIGYPILGSALKLFNKHWFFEESKQKYEGDIVYFNVVGQLTIILNSQRVAADLLDIRAATFSGRPRLIVAHELLSQRLFFVFGGHDDRWRRMPRHRAVNEAFNSAAAGRYHRMHKFAYLYQRYAGSLVLTITYDHPLRDLEKDDSMHVRNITPNHRFTDAMAPGAHLVEFRPWMLRLPTWY
ncbi:hypothetical protein K488DRAFT_88033 [Vararia minispora EC-137]|uniref:Uncharacterized protein n=1 Tax=Vararia minispora EC-137 TaxID=1314806 RepID=A0ACB8QEV5_9AGAM|nr:hypothetical protein K488DRAFT_88033 [Vararia minispora EC-137]